MKPVTMAMLQMATTARRPVRVSGACGDGIRKPTRLCDDRDTVPGDYCSSDCLVVTGRCGDGVVQLGEVCDDGNSADGDLCSAVCTQAGGILAPVASGVGGLSVAAFGCLVTEICASDLNGDVLSYALLSAPAGASIDSMTGLLSYYPSASQVGTQMIEVSVSDGGSRPCQSLGKCAGRDNR